MIAVKIFVVRKAGKGFSKCIFAYDIQGKVLAGHTEINGAKWWIFSYVSFNIGDE